MEEKKEVRSDEAQLPTDEAQNKEQDPVTNGAAGENPQDLLPLESAAKAQGEMQGNDSESLYKAVMANNAVRERVISEYLGSIDRSVPLVHTSGGSVYASDRRPKTIREAGSFASAYFRKIKRS